MDLVSPQDVYARHLVSRRGYPLWTPEPSMTLPDVYRQQGLKIGDVGVVVPEDGSFDVFFNICLPPTHSLHRHTGVPNNFTPVQLRDQDIAIFPEAESAGRIISTSSVARIGRQSSNENTSRVAQPGPLNYEFTLSSKEGALLILPEGAERYYLRNQRPFLEEAIQHAIDWYNFAEGPLGRIISHDSLYLITGFYKACSWSLASYEQASGIGGAYAQFKAVQVGGGNIARSYTWETTHALDWRVGPSDQYYNGTPNQSVFIQGFKIAVRSSILGAKRVKVKADMPSVRPHRVAFYNGLRRSNIGARLSSAWSSAPAANTPRATDADSNMDVPEESSDSGSSILDDVCEDITIQHIPQVPNPFHPSDIINQYLLRSHPSAVIAITHDSRWTTLLEYELIKPEELMQEDLLEELVCNMLPVSREGVVYLQDIASDNDESNASNDEVVDAQEASPTLPIKKYDTQTEVPETPSVYVQVDQESPRPGAIAARPREVPNPPIIEVQPRDVYKSRSSRANPPAGPAKPLRPILEGSKNASTSSMFKRLATSPDFVPETPKLPKLSLPEEPSAGPNPTTTQPTKPILKGSKNASTSGMFKQRHSPTSLGLVPVTPKLPKLSLQKESSSGPDLATGQPAVPLKSILKGSKDAQPHGSYESKDETLGRNKVVPVRFDTPSVLPSGSRLVPMKQPAFDLHWQLLPYDPRRSRRLLRFDVAFPVDNIVFQDRLRRTKPSRAELDAPAANGTMTKMLITFEHRPFSWEVDVMNDQGICCRDVFKAIYKAFNEQLTLEEQRLVRDRRAVEDAFRLRCKLAPGLPEVERSYGWKRADVLLHQTVFLGLTQPKSGSNWVLNLGSSPYIAGLS